MKHFSLKIKQSQNTKNQGEMFPTILQTEG